MFHTYFTDRSPCIDWNVILRDKCPLCCDTVSSIEITAFNFENENYNKKFIASFENINDSVFVNNRPVFMAPEDSCIWWHEDRNWWIGPCENVTL